MVEYYHLKTAKNSVLLLNISKLFLSEAIGTTNHEALRVGTQIDNVSENGERSGYPVLLIFHIFAIQA